jgi:hypothetical protein
MMSRRTLLAAAAILPSAPALAAGPALPIPPGGRIAFQLRRNGDVIGRHELVFAVDGASVVVSISLDILVKFALIPVYRYTHRGTERWRDGRFVSMDRKTDSDGTPQFMRASLNGDDLSVEGSQTKPYVAPKGTLVSTYWNQAMLQKHVISSEDGKLFDIDPHPLGEESVPVAAGGSIRARHWKLDETKPIDLWYDAAGQWAHLTFSKDSSTIIYEKL